MQGGEKQGKVQKLSKGEVLMLNIGSMCTGARVIAVSLDVITVIAVLSPWMHNHAKYESVKLDITTVSTQDSMI